MAVFFRFWGGAFLTVAAALFGLSFQQQIPAQSTLWFKIVSGILTLLTIYLFIQDYRHTKWREYRNSMAEENVGLPPPSDPIISLVKKIIRRFRYPR